MSGFTLSDPPTEAEIDALGSYVSGRVVVEYEDGAIQIVLLGPEYPRLVRYSLRPSGDSAWSEVPAVAAVRAFGRDLAALSDLTAQSENPQGVVLRLDQHARYVVGQHPGVEIARAEIYTLDDRDWLV